MPITLESVAKAVQEHLNNATTRPVSVGMRRPSSDTPAVVWELTSADCAWMLASTVGLQWTATVEVQIFGDTSLAVIQVADDLISYWDSPTALGASYATLKPVGVSFTMRTESQADGSEGDERVGTITLTIQGV
jgi:cytosine/adenosine deaminase-related metal-dependent hydrolase